jgi:hypothetical protein
LPRTDGLQNKFRNSVDSKKTKKEKTGTRELDREMAGETSR